MQALRPGWRVTSTIIEGPTITLYLPLFENRDKLQLVGFKWRLTTFPATPPPPPHTWYLNVKFEFTTQQAYLMSFRIFFALRQHVLLKFTFYLLYTKELMVIRIVVSTNHSRPATIMTHHLQKLGIPLQSTLLLWKPLLSMSQYPQAQFLQPLRSLLMERSWWLRYCGQFCRTYISWQGPFN